MMYNAKRAWAGAKAQIDGQAIREQVAALCYRDTPQGVRVLLITSRGTGRWIIPKGWPIKGKDGPGSAIQEAWEEAGVVHSRIEPEAIGTYTYEKGLDNGESVPIVATVYLAEVKELKDAFPEEGQRTRAWFAPQEAATLVDEPDLQEILMHFGQETAGRKTA